MHIYQKWRTSRLQPVPRFFWYSLAFAGTFLGIYAVLMIKEDAFASDAFLNDLIVALASFISFLISWIGVKPSHWKRRAASASQALERRLHFWIPLVFSIALLFQMLGNIIFAVHDWSNVQTPSLLGGFVILGTYPPLLAGLLLLPRNAFAGKMPLRIVMESAILIVTILTFSWYFLLGPRLLQYQGDPFSAMAIGLIPIFDFFVISCLILFSSSTIDASIGIPIRGLSLALVIFVLNDTILSYQVLQGPPSEWSSLGYMGGNFAIALSVQAMHWPSAHPTLQRTAMPSASGLVATPLWRSLLSYALLPVVIGLAFSLWGSGKSSLLAIGTYICCGLLLVLIFAKQFIVVQEVHGLNRGFQRLQQIVDEKNIALEQANAHLEALATTDPLTNLPNHRALVTLLDQELARSQQYQRTCSLLFFDLDHFKALNDGYGHAGGDIALHEFGALLRATLPALHIVGRWGGEEFLAILPEQDAEQALILAEQLRSSVANCSFPIGGGLHLTCSIGVASSPAHEVEAEALLQAADTAMYAAKRLGRNQVRCINDPAVAALPPKASVEGRDELTLIGTVHALALLVEKRDGETGVHAQRVGELLLLLAQALGLSEAEAQLLSLAGQLHDIGKIVIPDHILQKQAPLSEQELASIQQHPQVGAEVLSSIPSLCPLAPIVRAHHEWWNGMGYPDHLAGEEIPFGARLLALVDAYVVITANHPHRETHDHQWAMDELRRGAGTQFDPAIVEPFLQLLVSIPSTQVAVGIG